MEARRVDAAGHGLVVALALLLLECALLMLLLMLMLLLLLLVAERRRRAGAVHVVCALHGDSRGRGGAAGSSGVRAAVHGSQG